MRRFAGVEWGGEDDAAEDPLRAVEGYLREDILSQRSDRPFTSRGAGSSWPHSGSGRRKNFSLHDGLGESSDGSLGSERGLERSAPVLGAGDSIVSAHKGAKE